MCVCVWNIIKSFETVILDFRKIYLKSKISERCLHEKKNTMTKFHTTSKEKLKGCIYQWKTPWNKCFERHGKYSKEN